MIQRKFGAWKPDATQPGKHDEDYNFVDLANKMASPLKAGSFVDLRNFCSPIEDQGVLGSCVGNAVVGGLELLENRDGHPYVELSRLFIYYNSRLMHGEQLVDSGTYIRIAMGTLSSLGTCSEAKWPYDVNQVFTRPTWGSYRDAHVHRISSYYRIFADGDDRIEQIKLALRSNHPVVFGMQVDEEYMYADPDGIIGKYNPRRSLGGHAQLIVGFDDTNQRLIVRNSWGVDWGHKGYGYVPYGYLVDAQANDFWVPYSIK